MQIIISIFIILLYFTLIPELSLSIQRFDGCRLAGLGIHMAFWLIGLTATVIVFLIFLLTKKTPNKEDEDLIEIDDREFEWCIVGNIVDGY